MTRYNVRLSVCVVAAGLLLAGCNRYERKEFENFSPSIQASRFKTIATVAASDGRTDLRLMVQAREDLRKAGWNAVRASGRWDNVTDVIGQVCAPGVSQPVDGVLVVTYNHLVLYDCQTTKAAYEIQSSPENGGLSLDGMVGRLVNYLKGKPAPP